MDSEKTKMTVTTNNGSESNSVENPIPEDLEKGLTSHDELADHAPVPVNISQSNSIMAKRRVMFTVLIVLVGCIASAAFLSMGIVSLKREQDVLFERRSTDITNSIQEAWNAYETYGLWVQESCYSPLNETNPDTVAGRLGLCSREKFNMLIQSVQSQGIEFQAVGMIPNVTNAQRPSLEAESTAYYAENYPHVDYNGFVGFVPKEGGGLKVAAMPEIPSYWPVHYMEPVAGNEAALDLDLHSHPGRRKAIEIAVETWLPIVTERIRLAQETEPDAYSVLSYNPGTKYKSMPEDAKSVMLSSIAVRVPDLIHEAAQDASVSIRVNIFDATDGVDPLKAWMGGADIYVDDDGKRVQFQSEVNQTDVKASSERYEERGIKVADRTWVVAVTAHPGTFEPPLVFVILGGCIIMVSSLLLAAWFYTNMGRMLEFQRMKASIEAEKAAIILDTARRQAKAERQLNEYIAHEVRNPLCSAITALSFVAAATKTEENTEESRKRLRDDVAIIDASLQFINELLRNMLDMHRAADKQMKITKAPTDIRNDVLEPVAAILHLRGSKVKVLLDCPHNLCVMTDRMRLKQIALNLSINATKFVTQGFIRLRAQVIDGNVRLLIEDSGPGIPAEKRDNLFAKFQESLDLLNQGTGIGLCLCKHLSVLLGGDIWLDEEFDSGVPGCPGTRFVIDLASSPMDTDDNNDNDIAAAKADPDSKWTSVSQEFVRVEQADEESALISATQDGANARAELPEVLKVLFVDDDLIIRRLFTRAIKRIAAGWNVEEASNGETALMMCKSMEYDIIFMDQYMASVEKQLLGTETVRALRAQGVKARICGLSANDMEEGFKDAGANSFLFKPFPCEKDAFTQELVRILKDD